MQCSLFPMVEEEIGEFNGENEGIFADSGACAAGTVHKRGIAVVRIGPPDGKQGEDAPCVFHEGCLRPSDDKGVA